MNTPRLPMLDEKYYLRGCGATNGQSIHIFAAYGNMTMSQQRLLIPLPAIALEHRPHRVSVCIVYRFC